MAATSIMTGLLVFHLCSMFVTFVKNTFKYDNTFDVFGVHCIGGIFGALATGIVAAPALGGQGVIDYSAFPSKAAASFDRVGQLMVQGE